MESYINLANTILETGNVRGDRTGTGTVSIFGPQLRFDLAKGFPLLTTKKMFTKGIIHELLWFLKGDTNNNSLLEHNVHIWDEWAMVKRREYSIHERMQLLANKINKGHEPKQRDESVDLHQFCDEEGIPRYEYIEGDGDLGPIYGKQWRSWTGKVISADIHVDAGVANIERQNHDQIAELIEGLKKKPFSRRHIVSAWNVEDLPDESISPQENVAQGRMALAPCHCLFQFYVSALNQNEIAAMIDARGLTDEFTIASVDALDRDMKGEEGAAVNYLPAFLDKHNLPKYKLSCQLYQRSADYLLGVPFNIASYALLTMMIAQCVDMVPGEFIHTFGDCHIYRNHIETYLKEQQMNEPYELPKMWINPEVKNIDDFKFEDFKLIDYKSHGKIEYPISV